MPVVGRAVPGLAKSRTTANDVRLGKSDYERLAAFRHTLRRFLSFSEAAARAIGLASQQYQALLAVRGCPGRDPITISELARQLLIKHNSAVGLVDRLESVGLVRRRMDSADRRRVEVLLTPKGARAFERLAVTHHAELIRIQPQLKDFLDYVSAPRPRKGNESANGAANGASARRRSPSRP